MFEADVSEVEEELEEGEWTPSLLTLKTICGEGLVW